MLIPPIKKVNHTNQQATCSGVLDAMREYMKREQILQARLHVHLHVTPYYPVTTALLKLIIYLPIAKMSPPPYMELSSLLYVDTNYYVPFIITVGISVKLAYLVLTNEWLRSNPEFWLCCFSP